jgi:intein/homing endonuclease
MKVENQGSVGACFPAGTLVTLSDGRLVPIEDVKVGHRVRTHKSRSRQVIDTMSRLYTGDLITIHAKGWRKIVATACHRFWAIRDGVEQWICAGDLVETDKLVVQGEVDEKASSFIDLRDYVSSDYSEDGDAIAAYGSPNFCNYRVPLDDLTCRILGLFVAEGSTDATPYGTRCRSVWTLHEDETDFVAEISAFCSRLGLDISVEEKPDSKAIAVRVDCPVLAEFLDLVCGRGCANKTVPVFIMQGTQKQKLAFIRGYTDGDGSDEKFKRGRVAKSGNRVACNQINSSTVSVSLHQQLGMLMVSMGMKPGLSQGGGRKGRKVAYHCYAYGVDAHNVAGTKPDYVYEFEEKRQATRRPKFTRAGQIRPIRSLSREHVIDRQVFDFEVAEDHSFCANGYAVHNCQGHSLSSVLEWCFMIATGGQKIQLSRAMAYYETQRLDGLIGRDVGSTVENGVKLAVKTGLCLEELWKYTGKYSPQRPKDYEAVLQSAENFKIGTALNVTEYESGRTFLGSGMGGLHMGIGWGSSMDSPVVETFRPGRGGHSICALCLSERVDRNGLPYWWIMNSWSEEWGSKEAPGWQEWSPTAVTQMLRHNATVMVALSDMVNVKPRELDRDEWVARLNIGGDLRLAT